MAMSGAHYLCTFLLIGFAALGAAGPARAGSTATRCDAHGCVHVHCNATGDRCYRYADGAGLSPSGEQYSRRGGAGHSHLVCDDDGDRCYPSHGRRWDFRAYYRGLGYHWGDKAY